MRSLVFCFHFFAYRFADIQIGARQKLEAISKETFCDVMRQLGMRTDPDSPTALFNEDIAFAVFDVLGA